MKVLDPTTGAVYNFPAAKWVHWDVKNGEHQLSKEENGDGHVTYIPNSWIVCTSGNIEVIQNFSTSTISIETCLETVEAGCRSVTDLYGGRILARLKAKLRDFNATTKQWQ